jgi:hypothetical protein
MGQESERVEKMQKLLAVTAFSVLALFPQVKRLPPDLGGPRAWRTYAQLNGVGWLALPESSKVAYLDGVRDALGNAYGRARNTPCEKQEGGTYSDLSPVFASPIVIPSIDDFYDEPANLIIPIVDAVEVFLAHLRKVPEAVITERVLEHRRVSNLAPERKQ